MPCIRPFVCPCISVVNCSPGSVADLVKVRGGRDGLHYLGFFDWVKDGGI